MYYYYGYIGTKEAIVFILILASLVGLSILLEKILRKVVKNAR